MFQNPAFNKSNKGTNLDEGSVPYVVQQVPVIKKNSTVVCIDEQQ